MTAAENIHNGIDLIKVLVVGDSETSRSTVETLLDNTGCKVVTATDGFKALVQIVDHKPDIIFVDIMMPRLDGYQICTLIKQNQLFKKTPVIMLSGDDGLFDRARGRIVGFDHYLSKTPTCDAYLGTIGEHVIRAKSYSPRNVNNA